MLQKKYQSGLLLVYPIIYMMNGLKTEKLVEKYSGGRLGYIHIKGMDFPSFDVVEREFTAAGYGKEGLVIDVRYNGGGSTTDFLMTMLNYKQHAYTIPRGASENLEKINSNLKTTIPLENDWSILLG